VTPKFRRYPHFTLLTCDSSQRRSASKRRCLQFVPSQHRDAFYKELDNIMNRTFNILTRTESAATAVCASLLSVVTVGAVMALFATAGTGASTESADRVVLERVVVTASKSA
jgi:hypothetical protein